MTSNSRDYLISEDFIPLLQVLHSDIVILIDYILCIYIVPPICYDFVNPSIRNVAYWLWNKARTCPITCNTTCPSYQETVHLLPLI